MRCLHRIALLLLVTLCLAPPGAPATPVDGLYEATVTGDGTESGRPAAAAEALRQVVVRVTGRRAAAADPMLASLYADAGRYARAFRPAAAGQVIVSFDSLLLDARLVQLGQRLWSRERPATLVLIVSARPGAPRTLAGGLDPELRRALLGTAQARGVPLVWPAAATDPARLEDALAGRLAPLRELARQSGADGVLLGRVAVAGPPGIVWTWSGPAGEGGASGTAADAVGALADRYGSQFAAASVPAVGALAVVTGVRELPAYAAAAAALGALAGVRSVSLVGVTADTARYRIVFEGDIEALRRALRDSPRLAIDDAGADPGLFHLVLKP